MADVETAYARRAFVGGLIALAACGRSDVATERAAGVSTTVPIPSTSPTTAAPTTTAPSAPTGIVCRAAWGARSPRPGGTPHTISRLTVHHSAVFLADGEDPTGHLRSYQQTHMDANGWIDVAYHAAVDRVGRAYELRSTAIAGDTATSYDPAGHLLILAIGDFEAQTPTAAQLDGVARLLRWGADTFGAPLASVTGHRDHAATACPGRSLYDQLAEVRRRAEALPAGAESTC